MRLIKVEEKLVLPTGEMRALSQATKYPRACYYEPQCWKGWLDLVIGFIARRFRRDKQEGR